ncbi:hypothetical protein ADL26_14455 [Thermoactinomyces vulgaris]|nr:hypothetical protein ADL26_14455 [Thermoactinomyces vulgaris]
MVFAFFYAAYHVAFYIVRGTPCGLQAGGFFLCVLAGYAEVIRDKEHRVKFTSVAKLGGNEDFGLASLAEGTTRR